MGLAKFLLLVALSILLMPNLSVAKVIVSDAVFDSTTADAGTNRSVSVNIYTDAGDASITNLFVISSPPGIVASGIQIPFTVTTAATTKTFNITSATTNLYEFNITAIDSSNAVYNSSIATISYADSSSLVLEILERPPLAVYEGQSIGISVNLINSISWIQTRNLTIYENQTGTFQVNESLGSDSATQTILLFGNDNSIIAWNITIGNFIGTSHLLIRLGDRLEAAVFNFTKTAAPPTTTTTTSTTTTSTTTAPTTTTIPTTTTTTISSSAETTTTTTMTTTTTTTSTTIVIDTATSTTTTTQPSSATTTTRSTTTQLVTTTIAGQSNETNATSGIPSGQAIAVGEKPIAALIAVLIIAGAWYYYRISKRPPWYSTTRGQ